jgi:hypothetical protein
MYSKSLAPETASALKQVETQKRTKREKTKGLILGESDAEKTQKTVYHSRCFPFKISHRNTTTYPEKQTN